MKELDDGFNVWWETVGQHIDGKFAMAVVAWEASRKGYIKGTRLKTQPYSDFLTSKTEVVLTLFGEDYVGTTETKDGSCNGCDFLNEEEKCDEACWATKNYCIENDIIWIKKGE